MSGAARECQLGGVQVFAGILSEFLVTAYVEEMFPRVLVKFKRNVFRPD